MGRHANLAEMAQLHSSDAAHSLEVADIASGRGLTVRALLAMASAPIRIHAIDAASNLDDDILHDDRVRSVLADLNEPLPVVDESLDRVLSVNVVEHLENPQAHLTDIHRILRPGGLLILAHSDWDTTLFASEDDALTRTLVDRFVARVPQWAEQADGFMGRKLLGLARTSPFALLDIETWADPHRRFDEDSVAWKVARGVLAAAADDAALAAQAADWVAGLRRLADENRFLFTVTDVALVLRKDAAPEATTEAPH